MQNCNVDIFIAILLLYYLKEILLFSVFFHFLYTLRTLTMGGGGGSNFAKKKALTSFVHDPLYR